MQINGVVHIDVQDNHYCIDVGPPDIGTIRVTRDNISLEIIRQGDDTALVVVLMPILTE